MTGTDCNDGDGEESRHDAKFADGHASDRRGDGRGDQQRPRRLEGRQPLLDGWRGYYRLFPDYRIEVEQMMTDGLEALLWGRAGGSLHRGGVAVPGGAWQVPAAWRAVTDGARRLTLWQVFADNKAAHALLAT